MYIADKTKIPTPSIATPQIYEELEFFPLTLYICFHVCVAGIYRLAIIYRLNISVYQQHTYIKSKQYIKLKQ